MPAPLHFVPNFGPRRHTRGFTLIELLVVVGIIAVLSGFLLPVLIQARDRARKQAAKSSAAESASVESRSQPPTAPLPEGASPIIDALDLKLALATSYHRIGLDVFTRYQVDCSGSVVFQRPVSARPGPLLVTIPFPENILEARNVQLQVRRPGVPEPLPLKDLTYTRQGIYFTCASAPAEPLTAHLSFTAFGRDQFDFPLPPAQQLRSISITLDLPGVPSHTIPDVSLQPSADTAAQVRWEFENLVSDRKITVQIPAAQAPLARALVLTRLVAVAVLLFGAGFWFLSEQSQPGQLDRFRLAHFLLLALTYSLFFVIFAVLEFDGKLRTSQSLAASAVFSVPLLVLHVARVLNLRFAVTRVIPLAVFTLGLVLNGVYGGAYRDYVYIGATIFVIAYVTLSYEAWAARRALYQQDRELAHAARRAALTERITLELGAAVNALAGADAEAAAHLASTTPDHSRVGAQAGARARLERSREPVAALGKEYDELTKRLSYLKNPADWDTAELFKSLERDTDLLEERVEARLAQVQEELANWVPPDRVTTANGEESHCAACGHETPSAPFCPYCAAPRPLEITCTGCGERLIIPLHLLAAGQLVAPLFCPHCGTPAT